jgi:hypothetical protein
MAILSAIGLATGAVGAGMQFIQGSKMKQEAERGLKEFQHQELTNLAENLKPSLEAEKLAQAQADKSRAMFADVAQGMDASSAMAVLSSGQEQITKQESDIFSSVLDKNYQADVMRVQEEQNMRDIVETRKMEQLSSLKAQKNAGMQMQTSAIKDIGGLALSSGLASDKIAASLGKDTSLFGAPGDIIKKD